MSLHGVIVINKPAQLTSQAVVTRVKRILHVRKAGHTGTLDPFATGVLPVCLNEGTKLAAFLIEQEKEYEGVLRLGVETDTQDSTGTVLREHDPVSLTLEDIEEAFSAFRGVIRQMPPMYSALKHEGVRLYEFARQGIEIQREERKVTVSELTILGADLPFMKFRVVCSKGTYVRTLVHDIGKRLGCGAVLHQLIRTRSGQFHIGQAIDLETLKAMSPESVSEKLIRPHEAMKIYPEIVVDDVSAGKIRQGRVVPVAGIPKASSWPQGRERKFRILTGSGDLLAMAEALPQRDDMETENYGCAWRLLRVFALD
ncbi:MAG TPA: tRNA pseudouridine(55) synthase TruB [Thermodesulfobacteriota bacterium]|nr:tRNA pseudouridine(55) synthase TruB [Deltaproteobacteria bacterium]HNR13848.1 tRNA pseudouridine(55) synthase TruB [Thermodesulfobacteriota bacterium]HNU71597.1 tRNA pseudouridine(55) synthase TruB [Thermodesulfobacteriota bacterium]HOC37967.1 tRNA pseudouridine(55) synthase TruB [Thermodesulfobacteriota bacterium]HQO78370.1 tRNA pseudouridine(55) synthase TruB [Thermodesulfobacteriota bacterium]